MGVLEDYLSSANDIIGERSPKEVKYDNEVLRWMRKGKPVKNAIAKANHKYPDEALQVTDDSLEDVQAHYKYLAQHDAICRKLRGRSTGT